MELVLKFYCEKPFFFLHVFSQEREPKKKVDGNKVTTFHKQKAGI